MLSHPFRTSVPKAAWSIVCAFGLLACGPQAPSPESIHTWTLESAQSASTQALPDHLAVVLATPQGAIGGAQAITVMFNQPVVALSDLDAQKATLDLTIQPPLTGSYHWVGSQTLSFRPSKPLARATSYTVTVPKGVEAISGHTLEEPISFSFQTPEPRLLKSWPYNGQQGRSLQEPIRLLFNQPVELTTVRDRVSLCCDAQKRPFDLDVRRPDPARSSEEAHWASEHGDAAVVVESQTPYAMDQQLTVAIAPGVVSIEGPRPSTEAVSRSFYTYGPLQIAKAYCSWNNEPVCVPGDAIRVNFTNPLAEEVRDRIDDYITVSPALPKGERLWSNYRGFSVPTGDRAKVTYTITVKKGLRDIHGNVLKADRVLRFDYGPFYPSLRMASGRGVYERNAGEPAIPLVARNLGRVDTWSARVPEDRLVPFLQGWWVGGEDRKRVKKSNTRDAVSHTHKMRAKANTWGKASIPLKSALGNTAAGLLYYEAEPAEPVDAYTQRFNSYTARGLLQVTNLGLTTKLSPDETLVWVTALDSGQPLPNIALRLRDDRNTLLWEGATDASGLAFAPGLRELDPKNERKIYVTAVADDGSVSYLEASDGDYAIRAYQFGLAYQWNWQRFQHEGLVFTDRGVYKKGDTVHVKGILREEEGSQWVIPKAKTLAVTVRDARDEVIFENKALALNAHGAFDVSLDLAPEAPLGSYAVYAAFDPEAPSWQAAARGHFRVEAYRAPEFSVDVELANSELIAGDTLSATAHGDYFFGAPVAGGDLSWTVMRTPTSFRPPGDWERLSFVDRDRTWEGAQSLIQESGKLDRLGRASLDVKLDTITGPYRYEVDAEVRDVNRQVIAGSATALVHPGDLYLGVGIERWLAPANAPVTVRAVAADLEGALVPNHAIEITLSQRTWNTVREKSTTGRYVYVSDPVDTPVGDCALTSTTDLVTCSIHVPKPGYYVLRAEGTDRAGRPVASSSSFYAYGSGRASWAYRNDNVVELVADKEHYAPGDTADILVKSPWPESSALITVEKSGVLTREVKHFKGNSEIFSVPLDATHIPNAYVSVTLIKGRTEPIQDDVGDPGRPDIKQGYLELPVTSAKRKLSVEVSASPAETTPRATSEVSLRVLDADGAPVPDAEVTVFAVDEAVLSLTGYATPDPMKVFYAKRPLGVQMADSRLHVFDRTHTALKGGHPSGGGGGGDTYRSLFSTTPLWTGSLITDAEGRAKAALDLPENLTTFRVMAVAHTRDARFGHGEDKVIVSKQLLVRSALPRFARSGDRFEAAFVINNRSSVPLDTEVALTVSGDAKLEEAPSQRLTVPPGEAKELRFGVRATRPGKAVFAFSAESGALSDGIEMSIPVMRHAPTETVATTGQTQTAVMEQVIPPGSVHPDIGGLNVQMASTALVDLDGGVQYLMDYPFGCLEQTSSRVMVMLMLKPLLSTFNLLDVPEAELDVRIREGLARIASMQQYNGGFAMWPTSDHVTPYGSTNAMFTLSLAAEQGFAIDAQTLREGVIFLQQVLDSRQHYSGDTQLVLKAYALHVLARFGHFEISYANTLFESRNQLPLLGRAHLLLAFTEAGVTGEKADALVTLIESNAAVEAASVQFQRVRETGLTTIYDTDLSSSALATYALLRAVPEHPLLPRAAAWLLDKRENGRWHTTQKNATALLALTEYISVYEKETPDFVARVFLGDALLAEQSFTGRSTQLAHDHVPMPKLQKAGTRDIIIGKEGAGRLYYAVRMTYAPTERVLPAREEGFTLERRYESLETGEALSEIEPGSVVLVRLTLSTPHARRFVAIEEPLPAGLEAINLNFATNSPNLRRSLKDRAPGAVSWYHRLAFDHVEQHDDVVQIFADNLPVGIYEYTYLARATTYGEFIAPPAHVEEMYTPEVFGRTATQFISVP